MYEQIVVGTDGSPTAREAVRQAVALAAAFGARLHVVSAVRAPALAYAAPDASLASAAVEAEAGARQDAQEALQIAEAEARQGSVEVETHLRPGDPADALCAVAQSTGAQLIVVGNRGMRGPRRLLGSVPNAVSHRAPCAVLIVRTS